MRKDFYIVETIGSPGSVVEVLIEIFGIIVSIDFWYCKIFRDGYD